MIQEGVIKFQVEHQQQPLVPRRVGELACKLIAWREILSLTGLVGQDPTRYEGAGYGNVSARIGPPSAGRGRRAFLITGTQTSGRRCLGLADFAVVERYDYYENRVWSCGATRPSSESMTHGAVYEAIHQTQALPAEGDRPNEERIAEFYAGYGVDAQEFLAAMRGFEVDFKIRRATDHMKRSKVASTPSIVVNGRYIVRGRTFADMLQIASYLIDKERKE